jgi:hypothetical protein
LLEKQFQKNERGKQSKEIFEEIMTKQFPKGMKNKTHETKNCKEL